MTNVLLITVDNKVQNERKQTHAVKKLVLSSSNLTKKIDFSKQKTEERIFGRIV